MMEALWLTLRADLRRRWRAVLALALLLGVIGGVILTAAAGARRTDTAYPRLLRSTRAAQLQLITGAYVQPGFFAQLRRLPQVTSVSEVSLYDVVLPVRHGRPPAPVEAFSSQDDSFGITADRVKVLSGRRFSPTDPRAAMVDQQLAARDHLSPGSMLRLVVVPETRQGDPDWSRARMMSFRVSAIVVFASHVVPITQADTEPAALLSPAFSHTRLALSASYGTQAGVGLRPGAGSAAFLAAARALARQYPAARPMDVVSLAGEVSATQRAIRPEAVTLGLFAGLTAVIALAVLGQLLSRQLSLDSAEFPVLCTLGMTRRALTALALARLAVVTAVGAVLAVAIAIAASPSMPIGLARVAEPSPGVDISPLILGAGGAAVAAAPLLLLAPAAWQAAGRALGPLGVAEPAPAARPSMLGAVLGRGGPVTAGLGVRMAFEPGRGRTAVPVRSALAGTVIAVASVLAAMVFGSSLLHLVGTPRLYGQDWQQELDLSFGAVRKPLIVHVLAGQPGLAGWAAGNYGSVTVAGRIVPAIGIDAQHGRGYLTLLAGRPPLGAGEIAFGAQTLRDLHRRPEQRLTVVINGQPRLMTIAGTAVFASFSRGTYGATDLGTGAVIPASALSRPDPQTQCTGGATCYSFILLRYRPGTDLRAAAARLTARAHAAGCPIGSCAVVSDQRPGDIRDYAQVRDTPLLLGVGLALLAVGTLAHVLLTGVRRRRRDLAILKTLGLVRRQVLGVVEWQAAALAAAALLFGVPLGILAGRWAWAVFAHAAGVSSAATVPVPLVLAAIPVTVALAAVIAAWPGHAAARVRPAVALRAE